METEDPTDDAWREHLDSATDATATGHHPLDTSLPSLTVLAHPDPARWGERVVLPELLDGRSVELSRHAPLFASPGRSETGADTDEGRPLADPRLSRRPIRLVPRGPEGVRIEPSEGRSSVRVDGQPLDAPTTIPWSALDPGVPVLVAGRVLLLLHGVSPEIGTDPSGDDLGMVGASSGVVRLRREIRRVATRDFPVLLRGESGTGKELVARALHAHGDRPDGPFVAVNLAAIPPQLAAAELFGATRGAYTGADAGRPGYFQSARGGTLFLDEIGEAAPEIQALLLRAIESNEIQPVGSTRTERVDVRLVAATDARLEAEVEAGRFKSPLLYRLAGYEIFLPPLRDRRDDVGRLLRHFLLREWTAAGRPEGWHDRGPRARPWLPAELVERLARAPWPGNVRQLQSIARRLVVQHAEREEVPLDGTGLGLPEPFGDASPAPAPYRRADEIDDDALVECLRCHAFQPAPAAAELGVSRGALYRRIDRCDRLRKASEIDDDTLRKARRHHDDDLDAMAAALEVSPHGLRLRLHALDQSSPPTTTGELVSEPDGSSSSPTSISGSK